jgi:hypothetical protein
MDETNRYGNSEEMLYSGVHRQENSNKHNKQNGNN